MWDLKWRTGHMPTFMSLSFRSHTWTNCPIRLKTFLKHRHCHTEEKEKLLAANEEKRPRTARFAATAIKYLNNKVKGCWETTKRNLRCLPASYNVQQVPTWKKQSTQTWRKNIKSGKIRCWNLRPWGLKQQEGENIREEIEALLLTIFLQLNEKIGDAFDSVHCVGRREEVRPRQVIMIERRLHRDAAE